MKDDTISRAAAIDALADYIHNVDRVYSTGKLTHEDCMDAAHSVLDALPSAQLGWIPVTERLPEGIGQVIVQTNGGAIHDVLYEGKNAYGHEVWMRLDGGIYWDDEVVAWMPLPDLYHGD